MEDFCADVTTNQARTEAWPESTNVGQNDRQSSNDPRHMKAKDSTKWAYIVLCDKSVYDRNNL